MLPKAIARECAGRLAEIDNRLGLEPSGALAELGGDCEGSRYHSPRPLMTYRVAYGRAGGVVHLCGTCRDNLRLLENLQDDEPLPWDALREFGNRVRALGRGERPQ